MLHCCVALLPACAGLRKEQEAQPPPLPFHTDSPNAPAQQIQTQIRKLPPHNSKKKIKKAIWDKYFADSHAVIFVVDAADADRLPEARLAFDRLASARDLGGAPVLVLANKQDAPGAAALTDVAAALGLAGGAAAAGGAPCIVQPASARTGRGLEDGLKWLVEAVKRSPRRRLVSQQA